MAKLDPDLLTQRYGTPFPLPDELLERGNTALETILAHRSVRHYVDKPLEPGVLELLVATAESASTSSNLHCYSIIAVQNPERKAALSELCGKQKHIVDAPLFLLFCADLARLKQICEQQSGPSDGLDYAEMFVMAIVDAALAAQNLVTAAESLGLGTCYIGGARNHPKEISAFLDLPAKVFVVFGLTIGYPIRDADEVKPRLPQEHGILHHETYSADFHPALIRYEDAMKDFNSTMPGREGRGWLAQTARRVGTPEALGADRPKIKEFLTEIGMDLL